MAIRSFLQSLAPGRALNSAKDLLLSQAARARLNPQLQKYGTMIELKLNTTDRSLFVSLQLKGEPNPIGINIRQYSLVTREGRTFVELDGSKIETSREWLTALIQNHLGEKAFPIPDDIARFIPLLG
jgi:hypothetical protein